MTTGLLVSVRDSLEALDALAAGADLIDLKEPRNGALGPVSLDVMAHTVRMVNGRRPLSAALGELLDQGTTRTVASLPTGIGLAKLGLAGCGSHEGWPALLAEALARLPEQTSGVAVVYADWRQAAAPPPAEVIEHGHRLGCRAVLVDTFHKTGVSLLDLWSMEQCGEVVAAVHERGMLAVLAGSLNAESIRRLLAVEADYLAVRGAVCAGPRTGRLVAERVRELRTMIAAYPGRPCVAG